MMERSELQLVHGGRDLIETLEEQLRRAKAGELEIVTIATVDVEKVQSWTWACVVGTPVPWARMVAAIAAVSHDLMTEGLD